MRLGLCSRGTPVLPEGPGVVSACLDVTDEKALGDFVARVEARFGAIDCWVNNAGVLEPIAPLREIAAEDFRRHVDVNLTGVFLGTRAFLRHRRAPGVVDTAMQALVRATPAERFPALQRFLDLAREDRFNTPSFVAERLLAIAFDPAARPEGVLVCLP